MSNEVKTGEAEVVVPELMKLADAYAQAFNQFGSSTYNPRTASERMFLENNLRVALLSADSKDGGEPVAWGIPKTGQFSWNKQDERFWTPLYTGPQQQAVPLTDDERGELHSFADGVVREAAHQRERWGSEHDEGKTGADWFWLIGYLAGKVLHASTAGNTEKALHHTISTAAALANWHAAISGAHTAMRPGIDPVAHGITEKEQGA